MRMKSGRYRRQHVGFLPEMKFRTEEFTAMR
jgi:hypothetical protein